MQKSSKFCNHYIRKLPSQPHMFQCKTLHRHRNKKLQFIIDLLEEHSEFSDLLYFVTQLVSLILLSMHPFHLRLMMALNSTFFAGKFSWHPKEGRKLCEWTERQKLLQHRQYNEQPHTRCCSYSFFCLSGKKWKRKYRFLLSKSVWRYQTCPYGAGVGFWSKKTDINRHQERSLFA